DPEQGRAHYAQLGETHENQLMVLLARYPEVVEAAARALEPQLLTQYLRELANGLHTYYTVHQFLVDRDELRDARLNLIAAVRQVLRNGLGLLGVSAPETM
ncbi:MAG: DALR anticodon-binding domain-containing protein, partial [Candidatus Competibacterales bacterium]|nr:DALR anticodon-binding domain-containing protein [Candidatus Competibacterales bacterium]